MHHPVIGYCFPIKLHFFKHFFICNSFTFLLCLRVDALNYLLLNYIFLFNHIDVDTKMSTALDELKLLLLQPDGWIDSDCESKRSVIDALQLLLGVAEMKTRSVNRMMFLNSENHIESTTESIFSELNASCEVGIKFSSESDESSDRKTENYYTGDENYDVRF